METPVKILEENQPDQNQEQVESESEIEVRQIDPLVAAAELRLRAAEVNAMIASLEEAKIVTQETLQIEFRCGDNRRMTGDAQNRPHRD